MQTDADYIFQTPLNGKHLGWLFGQVFGASPGATTPVFPPEYVPVVALAVESALMTLSPREERVTRMRLGLTLDETYYTQEDC
jgi:hypothetical protein